MPKTNRYYSLYSKLKSTDTVFYCTEVNGTYVSGRIEYIYTDENNNWYTKFFYSNVYTSIEKFKEDHPYVLNIQT